MNFKSIRNSDNIDLSSIPNLIPVAKIVQKPRLQHVASGTMIVFSGYDNIYANLPCDCTFLVDDHSMSKENVLPGDFLYIVFSSEIINEENTVVCWNNKIMVRQIIKQENKLLLQSANPDYPPITIPQDSKGFKIIGRISGVMHKL